MPRHVRKGDTVVVTAGNDKGVMGEVLRVIPDDMRVVVQGVGPVGLAAAAFARLRGAGLVMALGAPEARCDLAIRLGADEALDIGATGPRAREDRVRELTQGRGADVVIEATGNPDAVPEGLRMLRDGGTYVIAGHYTDRGTATVNPHLDINRKHADIRGQWGTDFSHVVRSLGLLARHRER